MIQRYQHHEEIVSSFMLFVGVFVLTNFCKGQMDVEDKHNLSAHICGEDILFQGQRHCIDKA